jgi:hypothetical protein
MGGAWNAISDFISSICFAHAIHEAVESSVKDLDKWVDKVEENMGRSIESVKGFVAEIGKPGLTVGGGAGVVGGPVPVPPAAAPITVNITAPLVNVEGSADRRTAELASRQVLENLKSVIVEATSSAAPAYSRRIRKSSLVVM